MIYGIFPFCLIPASFVTSIEAICETFFPLWCVYQAINFRFLVGLYFA